MISTKELFAKSVTELVVEGLEDDIRKAQSLGDSELLSVDSAWNHPIWRSGPDGDYSYEWYEATNLLHSLGYMFQYMEDEQYTVIYW